jgi:hypothetical protein
MHNLVGNGSNGPSRPMFTLRSFKEIQAGLPPDYWWKYVDRRKAIRFSKLRPGMRVKVLAQSVGHSKNPCEEIWLKICHVDHKAGKYVGEVSTITDPLRASFHGLTLGMMINFESKHIIEKA